MPSMVLADAKRSADHGMSMAGQLSGGVVGPTDLPHGEIGRHIRIERGVESKQAEAPGFFDRPVPRVNVELR